MAQTTIEQFATELRMPAGALLEQLVKAGVAGKREGDGLSEQDKTKLLEYLQKQHGAAGEPKKKITLTRKQTTEIKAAGTTGRARTIQVEVRKKRVFVKRDETEAAPVVEEAPKPAPAPLITPEELAAREAEERKAHELIARQQEELQKKQEQAVKRKTKKEREAEEAAAKAAAAGGRRRGSGEDRPRARKRRPPRPRPRERCIARRPSPARRRGPPRRPGPRSRRKRRGVARSSCEATSPEGPRQPAGVSRRSVTGATTRRVSKAPRWRRRVKSSAK